MPQTMNVAGELNIKINGSSGIFLLTSAGLTLSALDGTPIGGTTPAAGTFTTFTSTGIDDNASATTLTITSAGYSIFGHTTNINDGDSVARKVEVHGADATVGYQAGVWSNDTETPTISLHKSRGASVGTQGAVQAGDPLFVLRSGGSDGTAMRSLADIFVRVPSGVTVGTNDIASEWVFRTTADGSVTPTERLVIGADGVLDYKNAGTAASVAANFSAANYMTAKVAGTTVYIPYSTSTW